MSSWLTHFTVVPTATVSSGAVKEKLSIVTTLGSSAATAPNASNAPTTGPRSIATTTARPGVNRAAGRRWLIKVFMVVLRLAGQRVVNEGERFVALRDRDGRQSEFAAELIGGNDHRSRRRRRAGSRLRERRRHRGV